MRRLRDIDALDICGVYIFLMIYIGIPIAILGVVVSLIECAMGHCSK
jgi:hypothetical protein